MIAGTSVTCTPACLFQYTRGAMLAWLTAEIRSVAPQWPRPRVFALGEAFTALQHRSPDLSVVKVGGTLADLLHGRVPRRSLAVAYAADLVGYLDDDLARAAIGALFRCVAPGGRLLVASFARRMDDAEYARICRDWCVVARDRDQVTHLLARVAPEEISRVDCFQDAHGVLSFTRLVRG